MEIDVQSQRRANARRNMTPKSLFQSWLLLALGILIAASTSDGISYDSGWWLVLAVIVLSLLNLFLKPLLIVFTLPFVLLTLGLGVFIINALLFMLVGWMLNGFEVAGFWSACWGALVVSLVSLVADAFLFRKTDVRVRRGARPTRRRRGDDDEDIIDI